MVWSGVQYSPPHCPSRWERHGRQGFPSNGWVSLNKPHVQVAQSGHLQQLSSVPTVPTLPGDAAVAVGLASTLGEKDSISVN